MNIEAFAPLYATVTGLRPQPPARLRSRGRARAVFIAKDGTLLEHQPYSVEPAQMRLNRGAAEALRLLARLDYRLIVVANQPGVAMGLFPESALEPVRERLHAMFAECGAALAAFCWCPHAPDANGRLGCVCRMPAPGLLQRMAAEHGIHAEESWLIGDRLDDIEAGRRAGCRTILLANGGETEWQSGPYRAPHYLVHSLDDAARVIADRRSLRREPVAAPVPA